MAIIINTEANDIDSSVYNLFPDQFVSKKVKESDTWIKQNMDYFGNICYAQHSRNAQTIGRNYELVKGNLTPDDFYMEPDVQEQVQSFTDNVLKYDGLPKEIVHYPILNAPLNEMIGELANRPDIVRVKAFDEDSKNDELQFKTDILQQYIIQQAKQTIVAKAAIQGQQIQDEDQLQQLTMDSVQDYLTDYTSLAEKWGNHVLEASKMAFNMKEVSEDCFRDLLISAREFYHISEDNSKLGLRVENLNPKNVWYLTTPDKKYMKSAIAVGTVAIMEISEVVDRFPQITKKEIDHLRKGMRELGLFNPRKSNLDIPSASGWDSIKYDTYNRAVLEERIQMESQFMENYDQIGDWLGMSSSTNTFGNKYIVVEAYWKSKKKVGTVTFLDQNGEQQTALVDESYIRSPNQIGPIEWNYITQWYKGSRIGHDVYFVEEFNLLPYAPILGVVFEIKNTRTAKSFIDLIKPYQIIFNVCMNQLFDILRKEKGKVFLMSLRHVPLPKDGDAQDAITIWEEEARKSGIIFVDDSPENIKGGPSSFNQFRDVDLTRTAEIQSRYQTAIEIRNLAWELVGASKERLGSVAASSTATGINTAVQQSYAQTEPYFIQHEYVLNDVYQGILDAFQYVETQKPESTISYINTEGEQAFIKVNSEDINLRDLQVYVTSRKKDQEQFKAIQNLAQPMLQNGAPAADVAEMFVTDSMRKMKKVLVDLKNKQEQLVQQEQQMKQQEQQQQQAQFEYQQKKDENDKAEQRTFEANENELNRLSHEKIAYIQALGSEKADLSNVEDSSELQKLDNQRIADQQKYDLQVRQNDQKAKSDQDYVRMELQKIQVERERIQGDLRKAKIAAKAKPKAAPKKK